jgi:hypothetical protein
LTISALTKLTILNQLTKLTKLNIQLESQQRKLKREISLLGPRQQQHVSARGGGGRGQDGADVAVQEIRGLPRSGWEIRQIEHRYRLLKKLKGGAMAVVYLAEDKATRAFYHEVCVHCVRREYNCVCVRAREVSMAVSYELMDKLIPCSSLPCAGGD